MGKSKSLDTKINSEPSNVPTPLPNQVEVLENINNKVMKTIEWEDIVTNIQKIMERFRNPTKRDRVTINQSQIVSKKETTSTPPVQVRRSSKINTSSGVKTETYFASANLLALNNEFRTRPGTTSADLAGSLTGWCRRAFVEP